MPTLLTALVLLVAAALGWWAVGRPGFTVVVEPTPGQLRARRVIWTAAGVLAAAAALWILAPFDPEPPAGALVVRTGPALAWLAMFFLWLALSGALSFATSSLLLGHVVRPRKGRDAGRRLEHRVTLAAVEPAEDAARKAPRIEPVGFLLVGLLALASQRAVEARQVTADDEGIAVHGFLPTSAREVAWSDVESVRVTETRDGKRRVVVRWRLVDGEPLELDSESLWKLDPGTLERLAEFHRARGTPFAWERDG
jgi:hypothetical protein